METNIFNSLRKSISNSQKIVREMGSIYKELEVVKDEEEKAMISTQLNSLKDSLKMINKEMKQSLEDFTYNKPFAAVREMRIPNLPRMQPRAITPMQEAIPAKIEQIRYSAGLTGKTKVTDLDKETLKRLRKKEEKAIQKKEIKPSSYVRFANQMFGNFSMSLLEKDWFRNLKRDLVKANMNFLAKSYLSVIFFNTFLSIIVSIFVFIFFLFFNFGVMFPFISFSEANIISRIGITFWILIVIPLGTFIFTYAYPSMEKKSMETKINQELPFATIHMASISESLVEPSNIFKIIISTGEYPNMEREFVKLLNEINVFGYDLVTALRNSAFNSPSRKLSELFDGLATTITSGGNLSDFFDKRAQTLLFDYKLDKEKQTKSAETFMDIYISVVIAAPMILMLLLIMMRVSGLGIALSTGMISLIMVLGVSVVNVIFLTFLQLKQT